MYYCKNKYARESIYMRSECNRDTSSSERRRVWPGHFKDGHFDKNRLEIAIVVAPHPAQSYIYVRECTPTRPRTVALNDLLTTARRAPYRFPMFRHFSDCCPCVQSTSASLLSFSGRVNGSLQPAGHTRHISDVTQGTITTAHHPDCITRGPTPSSPMVLAVP